MTEKVNLLSHIAKKKQKNGQQRYEEYDLKFKDEGDITKGWPINDDITNAQSNHAIQTC